ncbi:MAG: hypothetical protein L0216_15985 [Planctomycetales bacterium]|nr:hypothetical protein [Planctomycetales bacterium]
MSTASAAKGVHIGTMALFLALGFGCLLGGWLPPAVGLAGVGLLYAGLWAEVALLRRLLREVPADRVRGLREMRTTRWLLAILGAVAAVTYGARL